MIKRITDSIRRRELFAPGQHVLVAVSGGADSVALLNLLHHLRASLGIRLAVAHLNHGIRGAAAAQDAAFVRDLAARLKTPFFTERVNVPLRARRRGLSIEMAAREARYDFLRKTARRLARRTGAPVVIATAHTADDQAETLLLKLIRGAGRTGLAGIPPVAPFGDTRLVRPLLEVTRQEILSFLHDQREPWREDETNRDVTFLRNKVRHELLPLLERGFNPALRDTLVRTADVLSAEDDWLTELAAGMLRACRAGRRAIAVPSLVRHPPAARRRVLRRWLVEGGVAPDVIDYDAVRRVDDLLCRTRGSGETEVAGRWRVRREYDRLFLRANARNLEENPPFHVRLAVPGRTTLPVPQLTVTITRAPGLIKDRPARPGCFPACASLRMPPPGRFLVARSRQPGDRMRPLGMNGSKKLQDIFVDAKVPVSQRDRIPVIACGNRVVWLPGYRVAEDWSVTDPSQPALQLRITSAHGRRNRRPDPASGSRQRRKRKP